MTNREPPIQLLEELLKLRKRHGDDAFRELVEWLSDPAKISELQRGLKAALKVPVAAQKSARKRKSKTKVASQVLGQLSQTEPERAVQLEALRDALLAKEALPTARELRAFAEDAGLRLPKTTDRMQLVSSLIRGLSELDAAAMRRCLKQLKPASGQADRTLEGWTDIILKKRHHQPGK